MGGKVLSLATPQTGPLSTTAPSRILATYHPSSSLSFRPLYFLYLLALPLSLSLVPGNTPSRSSKYSLPPDPSTSLYPQLFSYPISYLSISFSPTLTIISSKFLSPIASVRLSLSFLHISPLLSDPSLYIALSVYLSPPLKYYHVLQISLSNRSCHVIIIFPSYFSTPL